MIYEPLPQERFDEIEACLNAATPGPWENGYGKGVTGPTAAWICEIEGRPCIVSRPHGVWAGEWLNSVICAVTPNHNADAKLIANAPTYLRDLLNELKHERMVIKALEKLVMGTDTK